MLDFTFTSPELMRGIVEWEVLDEETLSDHRYVFVKIAGNKNRGRQNQTRGGWSLRKLNNEVFLQRISAAVDVRDQQLAEQATEAAMHIIVEACEVSMPRRPANYHRKPAYWWNEELAGLRRDCNKRR